MTTKPSNVGLDRGIYASPFDAFTNYMNILGDFMSRVNSLYPEEIDNEELSSLLTTIHNQEDEIDMKEKEITRLQTKIQKMDEEGERLRAKLEKYEPIVGNNEDIPVDTKPVKKGSTSRTTNKKSTTKKPIVARKSAKKQD